MHLKRKAAAVVDADEASSGTTGHALGSHSHEVDAGVVSAASPRGAYKRQETQRARSARMAPAALDENAAALLLAIGGKKP